MPYIATTNGQAPGTRARRDPSDPLVTDPRTGRPIGRSELTQRNAQEAMEEQTAGARGEVYVPDPYGVRTSGGSSGGGGGDYGFGGSGGGGGGAAGNPVVTSPGAGGGALNLSRGAYEQQQQTLLEASLRDQRAQAALAAMDGSSSAARVPSRVNYDTAGSEAARSAAFARAKEQAGQNASAAMRTLQDVASRRGIRGSTIEGGMIGDIVSGGRGEVADFTREQLIQDLDNVQHIADTSYAGNITQRGQDQNARQAYLSILAGLY